VELAIAEAGLSGKTPIVTRDLRAALALAHHPAQRTRIFRIIGELGLKGMAEELHPYLTSLAAEERATAARALGRLHDADARPTLQALAHDPVGDVRLAAQHALDHRPSSASAANNKLVRDGGAGRPTRWTTGDEGDAQTMNAWQAALRARFSSNGEGGAASGK
jgi:hypothetical protein